MAYYAICNVNGPISHRIEADNPYQAADIFATSSAQEWIDGPDTHAEDDLDIEGDGMSEQEFAAALEAAGYEPIAYPDGSTQGGWVIWGPKVHD